MTHVLTLVAAPGGNLDRQRVEAVRRALGAGAGDWLAPGCACDLPLAAGPPEPFALRSLVADCFTGEPVDHAVVASANRRKRLLVADMDATIVDGETLDELAAEAGLKERIAPITARAMNGEIDFATALRERVALLEGLPVTALERTLARTRLMPGAMALVRTMRAHGAYAVLVSGGFRFFTRRIAALTGFDAERANDLCVADGLLTGRVAEPILDRDAKLATLRQVCAERGLRPAAALAVGDGANDLPMLQAAGLGVAFRAKPAVAAAAGARIDYGDLTALLFLQGYRADEIAP